MSLTFPGLPNPVAIADICTMSLSRAYLLILVICWRSQLLKGQSVSKPFPQHLSYAAGTIKPNHITQAAMDSCTREFYDRWKHRYLRQGDDQELYYVWFEEPGGKISVSEGQGYGMLIVSLMAGYDTAAKTIFDGLFRYYLRHPSKKNPRLMAWAQKKDFSDADQSSASDGDMDIAYSLLLANRQWGSTGAIDYLREAREMLGEIMKAEINHSTFSVLISDAVEPDSPDYFDMRTSDFMPAHFREFLRAFHDSSWDRVINRNYRLFDGMQQHYSLEAGLLPDFIVHINLKPVPAPAHYLESRFDGIYNYNACRVPWRVATDYLLNGDLRASKMVDKMNRWIRETTRDNPDNISAGYTLQGEDLPSRHFEALSFITPFAIAAMVDKHHQLWLNNLWDYINQFTLDEFDYYDNTIKMISLIIISGNYWSPSDHQALR